MAGDASLVYRAASLAEIEAAISRTHDQLTVKVSDAFAGVNRTLADWAEETSSRAAEQAAQQEIVDGVRRLGAALDKIRAEVQRVNDAAHDAEVRNVALLD